MLFLMNRDDKITMVYIFKAMVAMKVDIGSSKDFVGIGKLFDLAGGGVLNVTEIYSV